MNIEKAAALTTDKMPRALALVGMPGSGKTLCAQHLQARGYFQLRFGGIVVDEVVSRGWAINPENERIVREELRANEGMDVMAKRSLPKLQAALAEHGSVVIDGLYSFSEYKTLMRDLGAEMTVVAIICDRDLRYSRLTDRADRPLTRDEAVERDVREIEKLEKGGPIAMADYTLINNGSSEDLLTALDAVLAKVGF